MTVSLRGLVKSILPERAVIGIRNRRVKQKYKELWRDRTVVEFGYNGQTIRLCIVDPSDEIQQVQASGRFYEIEELEKIRCHVPTIDTFVDIGANTGQHSIFAAKLLGARKIIPFEPIPEASRILVENLKLNNLYEISDLRHLGIGLSDTTRRVAFQAEVGNLGRTILKDGQQGPIELRTGDEFLDQQTVDFIKIDTEGHEMKVLRGLQRTIERSRPHIYVEVETGNDAPFKELMYTMKYQTVFGFQRYPENKNYLIAPIIQR